MTDEDPFDRLLDAMPKIAQVVNEFSSEEVQRRAFDALIATLGATPPAVDDHQQDSQEDRDKPATKAPRRKPSPSRSASTPVVGEQTAKAQPRRPRAVKSWTPNRDLNVRPRDKQSLQDFVAEKQPGNGFEKNLVVVYWLREVLAKDPVDIADVMAAYRACSWPIPRDAPNSLSQTARRKGWLDTGNRADLRVTVSGENAVLHNLPAPKASKK